MLITMDICILFFIPCMMPEIYDVKMQRFTCSKNLNIKGYGEKKLLKVKLRGKAENAIQGLSHHGSLILKMTCAAKLT